MTGLVLLLRKSAAVNLGYVLNEGIMTGGVKKEIGEILFEKSSDKAPYGKRLFRETGFYDMIDRIEQRKE